VDKKRGDYIGLQGGPKSKPLPNDQKIVLKPVNDIRFIRQIKVWIKHNNIIRWHYIFYAWLLSDFNNYDWLANYSDMRHIR